MSTSNATLYFSAMEDMLQEANVEEQVNTMENAAPLTDTPKRPVRIRQHTLFAKDNTKEFVICRRLPLAATKPDDSPRSQERQKEQQRMEMLRQRRERCERDQGKQPMRRITMRI